MLSLTDSQLGVVAEAAALLPVNARGGFLRNVATVLEGRDHPCLTTYRRTHNHKSGVPGQTPSCT